jgi:hypothetical protein
MAARKLCLVILMTLGCRSEVWGQAAPDPSSVEQAAIYIECSMGSEKTKASGVIVSSDGLVLTAKHVVPSGSRCAREIGRPSPNPSLLLTLDPHQWPTWDIIALRIAGERGRSFPFVHYSKVDSELKGKPIIARGFKENGTEIAVSPGLISAANIDAPGIIDTTALTGSGLSGGPVVLAADGSLIGIVVSADFDRKTAAPISYGVFAVQLVAADLALAGALGHKLISQERIETKIIEHMSTELLALKPERKILLKQWGYILQNGVMNDFESNLSNELLDKGRGYLDSLLATQEVTDSLTFSDLKQRWNESNLLEIIWGTPNILSDGAQLSWDSHVYLDKLGTVAKSDNLTLAGEIIKAENAQNSLSVAKLTIVFALIESAIQTGKSNALICALLAKERIYLANLEEQNKVDGVPRVDLLPDEKTVVKQLSAVWSTRESNYSCPHLGRNS